MHSPPDILKAAFKQARQLAAATLVSLPVYVVIVEILNRRPPPDPVPELDVVRYAFFALSFLLFFGAHLVHSVWLRAERSKNPEKLVSRLKTANVITYGLADGPVVMGLVLFVGWRYYADFYLLAVISLYLMLRHFPRYAGWVSFVRARGWDPSADGQTNPE